MYQTWMFGCKAEFSVGIFINFIFISDNRTNFTQGGVNVVSLDENSTPDEKHGAQDRIGWVGWAGLGGSVFQVGIYFI